MKIISEVLRYIHLDKNYSLLSGKSVRVMFEYFNLLDIHGNKGLNDVQFYHLMKTITDLNQKQIYKVFDTLDVDCSGEIDFDEFYLLLCIIIAIKDNEEKQFIYRHSRTCFDLLDEDGSNSISAVEFEKIGFMFNFQGDAVKGIFQEFDVSGDQELDYKEFRMFAMACIDKQNEMAESKRKKVDKKRRKATLRQRTNHVNELKKKGLIPKTFPEPYPATVLAGASIDEPDGVLKKGKSMKDSLFEGIDSHASMWCTLI